jgi:membrane-associated phospholipid phosphatase
MLAITYLGSGYAYALLAPLMLAILAYGRRWHEGITLVGCLAGAGLLNFLLKHLFERARPELFKVISETGYSFPSGHAMVSLCFYGIAAYIFGRGISRLRGRLILYAIIVLLVAAIGISRVYLGVHYPSDVLAGYIAGGTWLAFCAAILWWWEIEK